MPYVSTRNVNKLLHNHYWGPYHPKTLLIIKGLLLKHPPPQVLLPKTIEELWKKSMAEVQRIGFFKCKRCGREWTSVCVFSRKNRSKSQPRVSSNCNSFIDWFLCKWTLATNVLFFVHPCDCKEIYTFHTVVLPEM